MTSRGKASLTARAIVRLLFLYREHVRTITTDYGNEFSVYKDITRGLTIMGRQPVIVYFADLYCSWQTGGVENASKLIRRCKPQKQNFNRFTDAYIMKVQKKINAGPRGN